MPRLFNSLLTIATAALIIFALSKYFQNINPPTADFWEPHFPPVGVLAHEQTVLGSLPDVGDTYLVGLGRGDITGPVVELNLMGYAEVGQVGSGLRQRLYSRAFIVGDPDKPQDRFVYLVLDIQSGDTAVRHGVLEALAALGPEYAMYGQNNVAITGTHSHSGPGGYNNYLLPTITSKGFSKASYQAIVDGAVRSIVQAHERLAPGSLSVGTIDVLDASVNRSPHSYLANPLEERARYSENVDKAMSVLRFTQMTDSGEHRDVGIFTWFAVHGTSVLANNTLINGDNKGVAAYLFEQYAGDPSFVAGFSQANVGDSSPNNMGAYCEYGPQIGQMCDFETSLCGGRTNPCHARGPMFGRNDAGTASGYEIGQRQFEGARKLFEDHKAFKPIRGQIVRGLHQFVDFSSFEFTLANGTIAKTCPAALGYSFAAGTSDWPGNFDFKQAQPHDPHANPLWAMVSSLIAKPNETQRLCHREKPILLDVGESDRPYAWSPNIVDVQLLRVGNLFLIAAPGEASTMAGRRWREAIHKSAKAHFPEFKNNDGEDEPIVLLGGLANSYTHYIVTPEEYTRQRYEGASTLYGPWTLDAHINRSLSLLPHLSSSSPSSPDLPPGPSPPINTNDSLSFISPVVMDRAPLFRSFGSITRDVSAHYIAGDTITARFVGANPRNNLRLEGTFAAVEKLVPGTRRWERIRSDRDWSLVYAWKRSSTALGTSIVEIRWETGWETGRGHYRLRYYGDAKRIGGVVTPFVGTSGIFTIV
ncbi:ceramidase like protein [Dissoconium aciculare CBS 342.82]|uniref:Neutral ceramidase n=1 Tax=Dissoconium aciculare CBS 342.82 TaxID=1314786 RepID=A0A6J3LRT4_9PEZI|nr:ceramidase like protein [Dissoconium aciculare CBS 342.82]KAF1818541.1 ceramidase like protein [Dissoconium aciculare CBS 342.82]